MDGSDFDLARVMRVSIRAIQVTAAQPSVRCPRIERHSSLPVTMGPTTACMAQSPLRKCRITSEKSEVWDDGGCHNGADGG